MVRPSFRDEIQALRRGVQQVGFKAVDHLQHQIDAGGLGYIRRLGNGCDAVLAAPVGGRAVVFGVGGVQDAAQLGPANIAHRRHGRGQHHLARLDRARIFRGNIGGKRQPHGDRNIKVQRLCPFGQLVQVELFRPQVGQLDQPIAAGGGIFHRLLQPALGGAGSPDKRVNTKTIHSALRRRMYICCIIIQI